MMSLLPGGRLPENPEGRSQHGCSIPGLQMILPACKVGPFCPLRSESESVNEEEAS